jgi:hypothetical protein
VHTSEPVSQHRRKNLESMISKLLPQIFCLFKINLFLFAA